MGCSGTGGLSSSSSWLVQNPWEKRGRGEREAKSSKSPPAKKGRERACCAKFDKFGGGEEGEKSFGNFLLALLAFTMQPLHVEILLQKNLVQNLSDFKSPFFFFLPRECVSPSWLFLLLDPKQPESTLIAKPQKQEKKKEEKQEKKEKCWPETKGSQLIYLKAHVFPGRFLSKCNSQAHKFTHARGKKGGAHHRVPFYTPLAPPLLYFWGNLGWNI